MLKLGRELGLIPVSLNNIKPLKGYKYRPLCSIEKWIGSIANASFIVTDSFHCMVFAILYKKNFVILPGKPDRLTRLTNLLKIFNIEDRFCENIPEIINRGIHTKQINYTQVHEILQKQRENSLNFLLRSLNNQ